MSPEPRSENLFSLLWSLYLSLNLSFKYLTISMDQYVQGSWKQTGEDIRMKSVIKLLTLLFLVFSFCSLSLCLSLSVSFFLTNAELGITFWKKIELNRLIINVYTCTLSHLDLSLKPFLYQILTALDGPILHLMLHP